MATVVLGVAGGVLGSFVGMPQLGFLIGSALGSYIDQSLLAKGQKQEGPRLTDRRVQTSSYGQMIPIVRGSMAVSGNVIWASDLEEESSTEESGGKGGPTNTSTLYSYFANFAVSLCEGPMHSVSRIWANGRLYFDASAADQGYTDWRFYPGNETQLPDPTIESFKGVGNTPAYRGQCYVVFTHLPVAQFGNILPQLLFEVNEQSTVTHSIETLRTYTPYTFNHAPVIAFGSDGHLWQQEYFESGGDIQQINSFTGVVEATWPVAPADYRGLLFAISGGRFWGWIAPPDNFRLALAQSKYANVYAHTESAGDQLRRSAQTGMYAWRRPTDDPHASGELASIPDPGQCLEFEDRSARSRYRRDQFALVFPGCARRSAFAWSDRWHFLLRRDNRQSSGKLLPHL